MQAIAQSCQLLVSVVQHALVVYTLDTTQLQLWLTKIDSADTSVHKLSKCCLTATECNLIKKSDIQGFLLSVLYGDMHLHDTAWTG